MYLDRGKQYCLVYKEFKGIITFTSKECKQSLLNTKKYHLGEDKLRNRDRNKEEKQLKE